MKNQLKRIITRKGRVTLCCGWCAYKVTCVSDNGQSGWQIPPTRSKRVALRTFWTLVRSIS